MDVERVETVTNDLSAKNPNKEPEAVLRDPKVIIEEIAALDAESSAISGAHSGVGVKHGWVIRSLGEVCAIRPPKAEAGKRLKASDIVSFMPMEDLGIGEKYASPDKTRCLAEVQGSYTYFANGDLLLAKITPCFENGKLAIAKNLKNGCGFGSSEYIVLRPTQAVRAEVLGLLSIAGDLSNRRCPDNGRRGRPSTSCEGVYRKVPGAVPSLAEQRRIVAILDEAFDGLARVAANAEKSLNKAADLLDSARRDLFSQKGAEWELVPLETLLERGWIVSHLDGNHGENYPRKEEFVRAGVPYISANCLEDGKVMMRHAKFLSEARAASIRKGVAQNRDVLFAHNATVGPVAILDTSDSAVILSTSLTHYRCNLKHILPEYLAHFMRSPFFRAQYEAVMRQSTRNQVPITKQREFIHVLPPLPVQMHIADKLDAIDKERRLLRPVYAKKLSAVDDLRQSLLHRAFAGVLS